MNQRVKLTRRLIKEALLKLLENTDIYHVTIKQICLESEINRSTFYAHYTSVWDVLSDIEHDIAMDISAIIKKNHLADLKTKITSVCEYLYEHKSKEKLLMANNNDINVSLAFKSEVLHSLMSATYDSIAKGNDEVYTELMYTYMFFGMYNVLRRWIIDDIDKTPLEIAEIICDILIKKQETNLK